jgi:hypothetical protein
VGFNIATRSLTCQTNVKATASVPSVAGKAATQRSLRRSVCSVLKFEGHRGRRESCFGRGRPGAALRSFSSPRLAFENESCFLCLKVLTSGRGQLNVKVKWSLGVTVQHFPLCVIDGRTVSPIGRINIGLDVNNGVVRSHINCPHLMNALDQFDEVLEDGLG